MYGCMDRFVNTWIDGWIEGRMYDGWMKNGWTDGFVNKWMDG